MTREIRLFVLTTVLPALLVDLTYLTYTHCLEVLTFLNGLNLFHNSYSFYWLFT